MVNNSLLNQIKPISKTPKPLGSVVKQPDLKVQEVQEVQESPKVIEIENTIPKPTSLQQNLTLFEMLNYCNIYYNLLNQLNSPFKILDDDHLFLYDVFKYKYYICIDEINSTFTLNTYIKV